MPTVDASKTIREIVQNREETRSVLLRHHVPLARMAEASLADVSAECGIDQATLVYELEQAIAESEPFDVGGFDWDVDAGMVRLSPNLARILGLTELSGSVRTLSERVHPADRARMSALFSESAARRRAFSVEYRFVRPDGAVRLLTTRVEPLEGGSFVGTTWDITEQRTSSSLASALEATIEGILVVDRSAHSILYNRRFVSMWRIPREVLARGRDAMLEFAASQMSDPSAFVSGVDELYAHPETETFDVLRLKDGRAFERHSRPQRTRFGIIGRVWSFHDVTERENLLERQTFLVDASRLLGSLDVESAVDAVEKAAVPYLGDTCTVVMPAPDDVRSGDSTIRDEDGTSTLTVPLVIEDAAVGAIVITARGRKHTRADRDTVEELARRIALSLENTRLLVEAEEAARARDDFLSVAAHEIRGPLASIHLAVQTLRRHEVPDATRDAMLDLVAREDRRLARFVDDILDVTRIRTGSLRFEDTDVDLAAVVRRVAASLATDLAQSHSTLSIDAPRAVVGHWDRLRLEQIVSNLLQNAIKFGLGRPIRVSVGVHDGEATLTVSDRGIGVAPNQREAIFEPFQRAVPVRHYGGLGLGLFIVRTIAARYGGSVHVEPRDEGASFVVRLPLRRPT